MSEFETAEALRVSVLDLPHVPLYRLEQAATLIAAREQSKFNRAAKLNKLGAQAIVSLD